MTHAATCSDGAWCMIILFWFNIAFYLKSLFWIFLYPRWFGNLDNLIYQCHYFDFEDEKKSDFSQNKGNGYAIRHFTLNRFTCSVSTARICSNSVSNNYMFIRATSSHNGPTSLTTGQMVRHPLQPNWPVDRSRLTSTKATLAHHITCETWILKSGTES